MTSIPENVASLKRQELQRLCKAHKIRANMKNTEMIQALQELRQHMLIEEKDQTEERADTEKEIEDEMTTSKVKSKSGTERETEVKDKMTSEEKVVENGAVMEDTVKENSTTVEEEEKYEDEEVAEMGEEIKNLSAIEDEKDTKMMEDKVVMMEEREKVMKIEDEKEKNTVIKEFEEANKLVEENMSTTEDETEGDQDGDAVMDTEPEEERTEQADKTGDKHIREEQESTMEALTMETESVRQHELVVEDSNGNTTLALVTAAAADDILNTTYTIEPPEQLVDDPDDALSSSLLNPSCDSPSTLPQGAWALGPALRDSPLLRAHQAEKENTSKSIHDNIMALLNARVEERKQEPGYCPKEIVDAGPASRIPVRSDIAQRFDDAHKKQFNQMTSIKDDLEHRKRRRTPSQNPTTNRPPLHEPLRKKPKSGPQPISAPKLKPDSRKVSTDKKTVSKHHKPATASLSKQSGGGRPVTHKTPKMPLTQSHKTPRLQSSSKRTLGYTPHKGPLPKYQDTVSK